MTIYDRIDELLKERKLSRRKLARLAGIPETTVSSMFARRPEFFPSKYAKSIAEVLNIPWQTLVAGTDIQDQTALAIDGAVKLSTVTGVTSLNGVPISNGEDASKQMHLGLLNRTAARMNDDSLRRVCKVAGIMNSISEKGQEAIVEFAEFQQNRENS